MSVFVSVTMATYCEWLGCLGMFGIRYHYYTPCESQESIPVQAASFWYWLIPTDEVITPSGRKEQKSVHFW